MKLEWIRCFDEVAQSGSISRTAQNLFITQPAVTKMIHSLETELDETLLIRTSSGVQLTEQGHIFLTFCRQVLNSYEAYLSEKNFYKETSAYEGMLELVVSSLLLQTYYDEIVQRITHCFPHLKIRFTEADISTYEKLVVEDAKICGLIMTFDDARKNVHPMILSHELYTCPIVLCASRTSKYASKKSEQLEQLLTSDHMVAIAGGKQNTYTYYDAHDSYTTNLDIVRKRLLYSEDSYVLMAENIAYKKLIDKDIILLKETDRKAQIHFLYHQNTAYPPKFLTRFAQELKAVIAQ
ncbi:MAG: LysR family transcriptional regulator [Peptococcaceae bacterium]|nr:LysR family transcriptional regulator [Peptococcaceae bacterium]